MWTSRCACLLVLLSLLVTGCSEPEPEPVPKLPTHSTESAGPLPSASPSETPSFDAELNHEPTLDAAKAFVRFYFEAMDYAEDTGDVSAMQAARIPSCEMCKASEKYLAGIYRRGGRIESGPIEVRKVMGRVPKSPGREPVSTLTVVVDPGPVTTYSRTGKVTDRATGGVQNLLMVLTLAREGWRVTLWSAA